MTELNQRSLGPGGSGCGTAKAGEAIARDARTRERSKCPSAIAEDGVHRNPVTTRGGYQKSI